MLTVRIWCFLLLCSMLLTACVTINVYFPVKAAEKAADQIIDKVWGEKEEPTEDKPEPTEDKQEPTTPSPSESLTPKSSSLVYWLAYGFDIIIPPAYAEANLDISSSAIKSIHKRMRKRHGKLSQFYGNGAIGLTNDALIVLRNSSKVPLKKRRTVKNWVNAENKDRLNLYRQIARANGYPEWETNIRNTFAKRWIRRASRGWWYQNERGQWRQK